MAKQPAFSWRQRLAFSLHALYVRKESELHKLSYLFWECTSRCNISCKHCGSDCQIGSKESDMAGEDFIKTLKNIATEYNPSDVMVVVSGGEPLVRNDLEEIGKQISLLRFPWGMVSNGYALTSERLANLVDAGISSVTISLDGLQQNHDWLREKNGSFQRAVNAIRMLVQIPNLVLDVVTCVNARNFNQLEEIKKMLMDIGIQKWRLFIIDPIGRAKENPELFITDVQFRQLMDFIAFNRQQGEIMTAFGCDGFLGKFEANVRQGVFFCRAGIHAASVLANGDISACPNINRGFVQGNIYHKPFLEIWHSKFHQFRHRKAFKTGICTNCDVWKWCRGDGFHLHEPGNPNPLVCHYHKLYP